MSTESVEVDPSTRVERHSLRLEQHALESFHGSVARPRAHLATGVHDAMPWNRSTVLEGGQRVSHLAGVAAEAGRGGHVSVRGHATSRYAANRGVDAGAAGHAPETVG